MLHKKMLGRHIHLAAKKARKLHGQMGVAGKALLAGAAGLVWFFGSLGQALRSGTAGFKEQVLHQKQSKEETGMKKSTIVALLMVFAAVAGVLGALYVYVLRRERELDEYEQLLFSEDFNDDIMEDVPQSEEIPVQAP